MMDAIKKLFSGENENADEKRSPSSAASPSDPADTKASLEETQAALDEVAGKSGFRCVPVSWEDAQRGTVDGVLSCWGGNISDVRLWAKDGTLLYTLRTENWNERLGYVASKDVAVVVGNHVPGGEPYTPITLQRYLKNFGEYAKYAGIHSDNVLFDEKADQLLSVRFQAVFLPIATDETSEFCTEVYNYNTHSDDDPRNVALLCTAQGTHVQQDGAGAKKMFIHNVDRQGVTHRYWLEAERSKHKVGGAQIETAEEAAAAAARGKATAIHIGTKEMGTRFNVQMLIQLPAQQKEEPPSRLSGFGLNDGIVCCDFGDDDLACCAPTADMDMLRDEEDAAPCRMMECDAAEEEWAQPEEKECGQDGAEEEDKDNGCMDDADDCVAMKEEECPMESKNKISIESLILSRHEKEEVPKKPKKLGTCNAARVSRGTEHDTWDGVCNKKPVRDPSQHGTITVTLYYTVAGGVPSPEDVEACVADLDTLYKACPTEKHLVDCTEITAELTAKDCNDINKKISQQPPI